jgi:hypothetical protein
MGRHQSAAMDSDVWLTPPELLPKLGHFDLDPCACAEPRPWPVADTHYTRDDDGLKLPWIGRVFMNPPYGGPSIVGPWMRKMAEHGDGIALIFARTETRIFHDYVWDAADSILFIRGRLFFHRADGIKAAANAGAPSCLIAYGKANAEVLRQSGIDGYHCILRA